MQLALKGLNVSAVYEMSLLGAEFLINQILGLAVLNDGSDLHINQSFNFLHSRSL